jgi:type 1 fimbria pilin
MRPAAAVQSPACTASPKNTAISIPSPVSIAPGASNGKIGQPSPPVTVSIDCLQAFAGTPNYYDNFTLQTGQLAPVDLTNAPPGGSGIMLQTNVPGIDVLLTATPSQASNGNNGPNGTIGWAIGTVQCNYGGNQLNCNPNPISASFTAQLVKTGPVSPGTISNLKILQFFDTDNVPPPPNWWGYTLYYSGASRAYGTLTLNPVTVSMSTCNVTAGSSNINVILPTIATNALPSTGAVAGRTAFNIQYSCPVGWSLYMTMNTTRPGAATGVILSATTCTSGTSAANIGIQVLQTNLQPVQFDVAQPLGNSPNGVLTLNYYAQYYATGSPTGAGPVCGTGTFTMSYQ